MGYGYTPATRRPPSWRVLVAAVAAIVLGLGILHVVSNPGPPIAVDSGTVVFHDNFQDPTSGWPTTALPSGTQPQYAGNGYSILSMGTLHHYFVAPYKSTAPALSATVTATLSDGAPTGSGFGVACQQVTEGQITRYEFLLETSGRWYVEHAHGPSNATISADIVGQGTTSFDPGSSPLSIQGICVTKSGSTSTRLVMYVNSTQVADLSASDSNVTGDWRAAIVTASRSDASSTVVATDFTERTLSNS